MANKNDKCPRCGSFLNQMGTCLACHPKGRERKDGPKPWTRRPKDPRS